MALSKPQQLRGRPYFYITEQPASSMLRFRYPSEGMSGSITGASSTPERPTVPAIKICGYVGLVHITMSCVTKDQPFRPHPHKLVGRDCDRGVYSIYTEITAENNEYQFRNVGIQCVTRCKVGEALRVRQELGIDPFHTGFSHQESRQSIDMSAVRLAFQVRLLYASGFELPLQPVASRVVHDKKSSGELHIKYPSHCKGPARGGTRVTVLCEKVSLTNIVVMFCQDDEQEWWEEEARIEIVHRQFTIVFHTPPYLRNGITNEVKVHFYLRRPSDGATSNSLPFTYHPNLDVPHYLDSKGRKALNTSLIASARKHNIRSRSRHSSASPVPAIIPYGYSQDRASYLINRASSSVNTYNVPTPIDSPIRSATLVESVMNSAVSSTTHLINCERSAANTVCSGASPDSRPSYRGPSTIVTWQRDESPTERPINSALTDTTMNSVVSSTYVIHNNPASVDTLYSETSTAHVIQSGLSSIDASHSVAPSPAHLRNFRPSSVDTLYSVTSPTSHPFHNNQLSVDTLNRVTSPTSHPFQNNPSSVDALHSVAYTTGSPMYNGPSSVDTLNSVMSPTSHPFQNNPSSVDALHSVAYTTGSPMYNGPSSVDTLNSVMSPTSHPFQNNPSSVDALHSVAYTTESPMYNGPSSVDTLNSVMSPTSHPFQNNPSSVDALHSVAYTTESPMYNGPSSVDTLNSVMSPTSHPFQNNPSSVDALHSVAYTTESPMYNGPSSVDTLNSVMSPTSHPFQNNPSSVDALHSVTYTTGSPMLNGPSSVDTLNSVMSPTAHPFQNNPSSADALHSVTSPTSHLIHNNPPSLDAMYNVASSSSHLIHSDRSSVTSAADIGSLNSQNDYIQQTGPSRRLQSPPTSWESNQLLNYLQHYSELLDDVNDFLNEMNDGNSFHDYSSDGLPSPN